MKKEIEHSYFFEQPPSKVWEYLTKPELMEQWLMKSDFKPVVGHKFRFVCTNITDCEVLEVVPEKLLSYSWTVKSETGEIKADSKVVWTLSEIEGGTALHLLHNGFKILSDLSAHNQGWISCLQKIAEHIKTA